MENSALFVARMKHTKESYIEFQRFSMFGGALGKFKNVFIALIFILGIYAIVAAYLENDNIFQIISGVLLIFLGINFLFFPQYYTNWLYRRNRVFFDAWIEYRFYDDHFTGTTVGSDVKGVDEVKYDDLKKICERKDCYFIIINSVQSFMLGKDSFALGTPEEFTAMMTKILPAKKFIRYSKKGGQTPNSF